MIERLLTERELAERTGLTVHYFRKKRLKGGGPFFVSIGRAVRYPEPEFLKWLGQFKLRRSTSEAA